jgi:hypothetical protein
METKRENQRLSKKVKNFGTVKLLGIFKLKFCQGS